jgi:hypothetical protein
MMSRGRHTFRSPPSSEAQLARLRFAPNAPIKRHFQQANAHLAISPATALFCIGLIMLQSGGACAQTAQARPGKGSQVAQSTPASPARGLDGHVPAHGFRLAQTGEIESFTPKPWDFRPLDSRNPLPTKLPLAGPHLLRCNGTTYITFNGAANPIKVTKGLEGDKVLQQFELGKQANAALQSGDPEEAVKLIRQAQQKKGPLRQHLLGLKLIALTQVAQKDLIAIKRLCHVLNQDGVVVQNNIRVLIALSMAHIAQTQLETALAHLNKAITKYDNPSWLKANILTKEELATLFLLRGKIRFDAMDYRRSVKDLKRVMELGFGTDQIKSQISQCYQKRTNQLFEQVDKQAIAHNKLAEIERLLNQVPPKSSEHFRLLIMLRAHYQHHVKHSVGNEKNAWALKDLEITKALYLKDETNARKKTYCILTLLEDAHALSGAAKEAYLTLASTISGAATASGDLTKENARNLALYFTKHEKYGAAMKLYLYLLSNRPPELPEKESLALNCATLNDLLDLKKTFEEIQKSPIQQASPAYDPKTVEDILGFLYQLIPTLKKRIEDTKVAPSLLGSFFTKEAATAEEICQQHFPQAGA